MTTYNNIVCGYQKIIPVLLALALLLISTLIPITVNAATKTGSYHVILNGRSIHMNKAPVGTSFNENNVGSGVQYEFKNSIGSKWVSYATGSAFNDSFNNLSYYAGGGQTRRYSMSNGWHFDAGYVAFVMARQDVNEYQPFLGVLPVASIGTKKIALNMTYVPNINAQFQELIFFQLKVATDNW